MMSRTSLILALAVTISACSGADSSSDNTPADTADSAVDSAATEATLFESKVQPILSQRCVACHLTGTEAGELALVPGKAIGSLVDVPSIEAEGLMRVKSGDPDASYLIMKLEGTHTDNGGTGAQMPFGAPPLSPENITTIRDWIKQGAKP